MSSLGDVDGDGRADFAVGWPNRNEFGGEVFVVSGTSGEVIWRREGAERGLALGTSVAGFVDFDGDGVRDVLVGAPRCPVLPERSKPRLPGRVYLLSGRDGGALAVYERGEAWDGFGTEIRLAGDVDGDGIGDAIVGSPEIDEGRGRVDVLSGRDGCSIFAWRGSEPGERFGVRVSGAGDLDGDGRAELLVGEWSMRFRTPGRTYVLNARLDVCAPVELAGWTFGTPDHRFGSSVSDVGDVDGDGVPEILVGADREASDGRALLISISSGGDARVLHELSSGNFGFSSFGTSVVGLGDVDGDGQADLAIADADSTWYDGGESTRGQSPGCVYVFSGGSGVCLWWVVGEMAFDRFGTSLERIEDLDGDGADDVLAQSTWYVWVLSGADGSTLLDFRRP